MSNGDKNAGDAGSIDDLAAEFVLGTLASDEMADAAQRAAADPSFAQKVAGWQNRLAPLLDAIPEVTIQSARAFTAALVLA